MDIITAGISRNPDNIRQYYRHAMRKEEDLHIHPLLIPLRDIANNTTSNLARINGSELNRGIKAALLAEPVRAEPLEVLLTR